MPADIFGHVPSPSGTIAYWDDDPVNLPAGWVVCDGNNGTPNLLDEFMKNVPDGSTNPGSTGGQHSVTLSQSQMGQHDHYTGSTDTAGSHNHGMPFSPVSTENDASSWDDPQTNAPDTTDSISQGNHSHSITLGNTGSGSSIENRPSYYELVPVMKT